MAEIKNVRTKAKTITLNDGVERELRFTLNAMAEIEERYGSVEKGFEAMQNNSFKAIRFVLWAGLMESAPELTERQVGSLIDTQSIEDIIKSMSDALDDDMPDKKDNVTALPNA